MSTTRPRSLRERALEKVDRRGPDECWPWTGRLQSGGYGQIRENGRTGPALMAHRVVYTLLVGPIPEGFTLDHTCHNADSTCPGGWGCPHRRCCNPAHLEPVTHQENILRGEGEAARHSRQTHCVNGHPFDEANTYVRPRGTGRDCRTCRAERKARFNERAALGAVA